MAITFPPLFETKAAEIVGTSVRMAELEAAQYRNDRRNECLDYYNNEILLEDGGADEYLKDYFRTWNGEKNIWEYPNFLILEHVPLTRQLVDAKARTYRDQPVRKYRKGEGEVQEADKYTQLLKSSGWFPMSKRVEQYTQLLGDVAVAVGLKDGKLYWQILTEYYPFFAEDDEIQLEPVGVLYPTALRDDDSAQLWAYIDAEKKVLVNQLGQTVKDEPNEYGVLNVFFPHRVKPVESFTLTPRVELIEANRALDVAMTTLNQMIRYNGYKQLVIKGDVKGQAGREFMLGMTQVLVITPGGAELQPADAMPLDMQANFQQHVDTLKFKIELAAQALNLAFEWRMEGGGVKSGRALEVQNVRDYDDRMTQIEIWDESIEQPLFNIVSAMSKRFGLGVEQGELVCDWPEPDNGFPDINAEIAWRKHLIETGVKNPVDLIMEENPDLDEEEAVAVLHKNLQMNRLLAAGGEVPEEQTILDILRGLDVETGAGNPGTPGGAGEVPGEGEGGRGGVAGALEAAE